LPPTFALDSGGRSLISCCHRAASTKSAEAIQVPTWIRRTIALSNAAKEARRQDAVIPQMAAGQNALRTPHVATFNCALNFAYYNFCKVHNTIRMTPAMAAGVEKSIWTVEDLLKCAENKIVFDYQIEWAHNAPA